MASFSVIQPMDTEEKFDVSTKQIYVLIREDTYDFIKDQYNIEDFPVEDTDGKLIIPLKKGIMFFTSPLGLSVCLSVCLCVCVCHQVCHQMAGLINMATLSR